MKKKISIAIKNPTGVPIKVKVSIGRNTSTVSSPTQRLLEDIAIAKAAMA